MILTIAETFYWISFGLLAATWIIYPAALAALSTLRARTAPVVYRPSAPTSVTVLVAAHNEERSISARIQNILTTAPMDVDFEILIASDGSTDRTVEIVDAWAKMDQRVKVFATHGARGKVAAHNQGVKRCRGDIIVFTDAETEFAPGFLDVLLEAFNDPSVGFASGAIVWRNRSGGLTGENFSIYWRYELLLRRLETDLGIHALGTGACSAVRRHLYRDIVPSADQDFITPLDAVLQGYKCVFVPTAKAYDYVSETAGEEFRARVRMTAKNFANTFSHWGQIGFKRFPMVSLGLVLHKLFRWLTPYFLITMLVAGTVAIAFATKSTFVAAGTTLVYLALVYGALGSVFAALPFAGSIWSFMIANAAIANGVWRALSGNVPTAFR